MALRSCGLLGIRQSSWNGARSTAHLPLLIRAGKPEQIEAASRIGCTKSCSSARSGRRARRGSLTGVEDSHREQVPPRYKAAAIGFAACRSIRGLPLRIEISSILGGSTW